MQTHQIGELDAHHAGADRAAPAPVRLLRWPDAGVAHRFFRGRESEAMRAVRELEQLALADRGIFVEMLHLGSDVHRKAARVKARDGSHTAAAGEKPVPGLGNAVSGRRDEPDSCDGDAPLGLHCLPPTGAISSPPRAICLPFMYALVLARITLSSPGGTKSTRSSTTSPGEIKVRSLRFGTRSAASRAPGAKWPERAAAASDI